MPWVRIDENMPDHPKVRDAGPVAYALWLAGTAYANRFRTDGHIPAGMIAVLVDLNHAQVAPGVTSDALAAELVRVGLWEIEEGRNGYLIHDYLDFQPSRAQLEEDRRKKSESGKLGGQKSAAAKAAAQASAQASAQADASAAAQAAAPASAPGEFQPRPDPSRPSSSNPLPHAPPPLALVAPSPGGSPSATADRNQGTSYERDFEEFWALYPRKVEKAAASKAYAARRRAGHPAGELLVSVRNYKIEVAGRPLEYVKHGATFLAADDGPWFECLAGPRAVNGHVPRPYTGPESH